MDRRRYDSGPARRAGDAEGWLDMRNALWLEEAASHAIEIQQHVAGAPRMPLEVPIAVNAPARRALGFSEAAQIRCVRKPLTGTCRKDYLHRNGRGRIVRLAVMT